MKQNLNPIHEDGDRNLFCTYYSDCLGHAAKHHWKCWACFNCRYKLISRPSVHGPITTKETVLYYTLPEEFFRK